MFLCQYLFLLRGPNLVLTWIVIIELQSYKLLKNQDLFLGMAASPVQPDTKNWIRSPTEQLEQDRPVVQDHPSLK